MNSRLPNLLVIGAMKAGTTSLHEYLNEHPDIFMSTPKELHYYADSNYNEWTKEKYMSYFQTEKLIAGTSPQSYTKCHNKFYRNIPERIFKDSPDVKLIYLVRDPIERYKSHVLESYHCDPLEDIKYSKESGNYWKTSMYSMQLKAYLKFFSMEQIHIVSTEDLSDNPLSEMNKIFNFLGIEKLGGESLFQKRKNLAENKALPRRIKDSYLYRIGAVVNSSITSNISKLVAKQFFKSQLKKPYLDEYKLKELEDKLTKDINEFREITGKKFPKWSI